MYNRQNNTTRYYNNKLQEINISVESSFRMLLCVLLDFHMQRV